MLTSPDGPFIQVARLNLPKYAQNQSVARALFEHLFHHASDIRAVSNMFMINSFQVNFFSRLSN